MSAPLPAVDPPPPQQPSGSTEIPPIPLDSATDGDPSTPQTTATKRITAAAKKELFDFFTRSKWTRNKKMPKANAMQALDDIINRHGLKREQAARQLRSWKHQQFGHALVQIIIGKEQLEEAIYEIISVPLEEYVTKFLNDVYEGNDIAGCQDTTNLCRSLQDHVHSSEKRKAIKYIHDNPNHECNKILVDLVRKFTSAMADHFPKTASKLSDAEMEFALSVRSAKNQAVKKWMECFDATLFGYLHDKHQFGHMGLFVFDCLYSVWCLSSVEDDRPDIDIPSTNLVGKYSRPIVYYAAGWTLQRASLARTVAVDDRGKYVQFASRHSIDVARAKAAQLPYEVVELRQKRSLIFCSKKYYEFICVVESTYIQNLTLKMMLAYADGDLVNAIHQALYASEKIRSMFFALNTATAEATEEEQEEEQQSQLEIMKFILDRYVRMRGCWFVKFLKNNQGKSLDEQKLAAAPTTMKVASAGAASKAAADARVDQTLSTAVGENDSTSPDERALWNTVATTVMEYEDEEDRNETDENMEINVQDMIYEDSDDDE